MHSDSIKTTLDGFLVDDEEVKTTVIDFADAQIKRSTKGDLCMLTVSGAYSKTIGKEIERICLASTTNVGLEFTNIKSNPISQKKFDSTIVGFLRNIRDRFRIKQKQLLLCMPPSELIDLLKLTGVYEGYQVIEKPSSAVLAQDIAQATTPQEDEKAVLQHHSPPQEHVGRRIIELNTSLKRTASLEKGLESAEKCVKHFLPKSPPIEDGYTFAFSYRSSERVGGDFFDFIRLNETTMGLLIGDVSGHGLDAAILMGITKKVIALRARDPQLNTPKSVLVQANQDLFTDFSKYSFATVLYATLDLPSGTLTLARAGHELPITFSPGSVPTSIDLKGIPIGPTQGKTFSVALEEKKITIPHGGYALFFTDGISECWSPRGELFGRPRLLFALSQIRTNTPCQQVLDNLLQTVTEFADGRTQEDDMTALIIMRS